MGRLLYSLQLQASAPPLSPDLLEAIRLRESLTTRLGNRQSVRWSTVLVSWWNTHATEFPLLSQAIAIRSASLCHTTFDTLVSRAINAAQELLFATPFVNLGYQASRLRDNLIEYLAICLVIESHSDILSDATDGLSTEIDDDEIVDMLVAD